MVLVCLVLTAIVVGQDADDQQKEPLFDVTYYGHLAVLILDAFASLYLFYDRNKDNNVDNNVVRTDSLPIWIVNIFRQMISRQQIILLLVQVVNPSRQYKLLVTTIGVRRLHW